MDFQTQGRWARPGGRGAEAGRVGQAGLFLSSAASRGRVSSARPGPEQGAPSMERSALPPTKPFQKLLLQGAEGRAGAINQN